MAVPTAKTPYQPPPPPHPMMQPCLQRLDLMLNATSKAGGVYLYANQRGCDGGRLYFDGCACVVANGRVLAQVRANPSLDWRFFKAPAEPARSPVC